MDDMLYCIRIADDSDDFNLLAELLAALELDYSCWEDRENRRMFHTVYTSSPELRDAAYRTVTGCLDEWRSYGAEIGEIECFELAREDWANVWKKYFHVIEISDTLAIQPSWLEFRPRPGQAVVRLDPGMSFGTGQHATTSYCLKVLDRMRIERPELKSFLDAGCGSGILSIAASLRGYSPVECFDFDPDAVGVAAENLASNGISTVIPQVGDAADYPGRPEKYDLVCANILGHLLKAFSVNIASWVRPGGFLVLAGILSGEFDGVGNCFTALGFDEIDRFTEKEWTGGTFRKK